MKIESDKEMREVAQKLLSCYRKAVFTNEGALLLLLKGDLGAGKTTFVQALARELGVNEKVTSPTFVIQKEYTPRAPEEPYSKSSHDFERLIHIDAYRLESLSELETLGWSEYISDTKAVVALEWPERVEGVENHQRKIEIEFQHDSENSRNILFEGKSAMC
ncbi:MAG: tRNA (adenosine(37)-N6)-threonylcarbamoyltransferase complex ATPase subunit type 1 TsaE [Candidatus Paceibacterota bacterium]